MRKNVEKLQRLRSRKKNFSETKFSRQRPRLSSITRQFEKVNTELFQTIKNNYDPISMAVVLKDKIIKKDPHLTSVQIDLIVKSMIENQGGCPV